MFLCAVCPVAVYRISLAFNQFAAGEQFRRNRADLFRAQRAAPLPHPSRAAFAGLGVDTANLPAIRRFCESFVRVSPINLDAEPAD